VTVAMTPRQAGFHMPAEWAPHEATWLAWPSHADLWGQHLEPARAAFVRLAMAVAAGERVEVLAPDESSEGQARAALGSERVRVHRMAFGDIWLRDTAPLFLVGSEGEVASVRFFFNGWGGKYVLDHDDRVAEGIATLQGARAFKMPLVLEGGAIEVDGEGTLLTTRQCLLRGQRNAAMPEIELERALCDSLGVRKVLWLENGLENDHTDGHVDTLARFVRPGVVVAMESRAPDDPNGDVLRALLEELEAMVDARGQRLRVVRIPSPGRIADADGRVMPASYANFYVANACVVVPTYGSRFDEEAVHVIGGLFPERRIVSIDARAVLSGGGAFHCITQQQPRGGRVAP
jgi:agmatine deiminase